MASVDFKKLHNIGDVGAMLRHNDTEERLRHEHSNPDIDKSHTRENIDFGGRSYADTVKRYKERIAELDMLPGANRRKDRVTCFSLVIPVPTGIDGDKARDWCFDMVKLLAERYGEDNMVSAHAHFDEIHRYYDTQKKEWTESRPHVHVLVVPEIDGKLNGKRFSSRTNMVAVNKKIDAMSRKEYGVNFLTGETPQKQRTERLKARSAEIERQIAEQRAAEVQTEIQKGIRQISALKKARELLEKGNVYIANKLIQKIHQKDDLTR